MNYQKHKKQILQQHKEYYQTHKEEKNSKSKEYYQNHKEERKQYAIEHIEKTKNYKQKYYIQHKKEIKLKNKKYYDEHKKELKIKEQEYRKTHGEEKKIYRDNKLRVDINFKLACYLRSRLVAAVKNNQKSGSAVRDLGCSIPELKTHLESKFQEGMSWENWSPDGWHIDHIIPLDSFDLQDREEFLKANNYTNLNPLWAKENLSKGNKIQNIEEGIK